MRIAVPVSGEAVSETADACETLRLYEDDHGRILRQSVIPLEGGGFDAMLRAVERVGADVLVCGALTEEQRRTLAMDGVLLSPGAYGSANAAVRSYLGAAIACDPSNNCNYCGHKTECELERNA